MNTIKLCMVFLLLLSASTMQCQQVITKPGHYKLGENIVFNPTAPDQAALTIASSDVLLDLDNYVITQASNNINVDTHGIMINDNLFNITIKNGQVSQLTGSGIIISEGCSRIFIDTLVTYSCGLIGIDCVGTANNPLINIVLDNCCSYSCGQLITSPITGGIHFGNCFDSVVRNCKVNNNMNMITNMSGIFIDNCERCTFKNVKAKNNQGFISCGGFAILNGQDNYFQNCYSFGNNVLGFGNNFSLGFVTFGSLITKTTFMDCIAAQNQGGDFAAGFFITNTAEDINFINCHSLSNTATLQANGFFIQGGTHINCIDCTAKGNATSTLVSTTAIGFNFFTVQNSTIVNCIAAEQQAETAMGFSVDNCTQCEFKNSKALINTGTSDLTSFGFVINNNLFPDAGNNQFIHNIAADNGLIANNQCANFPLGTAINTNYGSLNTIVSPFINIGIVPL